MIRPPPISTLFPYTTLFRSGHDDVLDRPVTVLVQVQDAESEGPGEQRRRDQPETEDQIEADRRPEKDRKSTRLNSSHANISYAVFCLKKKKTTHKLRKANTP